MFQQSLASITLKMEFKDAEGAAPQEHMQQEQGCETMAHINISHNNDSHVGDSHNNDLSSVIVLPSSHSQTALLEKEGSFSRTENTESPDICVGRKNSSASTSLNLDNPQNVNSCNITMETVQDDLSQSKQFSATEHDIEMHSNESSSNIQRLISNDDCVIGPKLPKLENKSNESISVSNEISEDNPVKMEAQTETAQDLSRGQFEIQYDFSKTPTQVAWTSFQVQEGGENFFKGCKWSPDGTCLLTNSEDKLLRVFELPAQLYSGKPCENTELSPVLQMREGEIIYDYAWYPLMSSTIPESCCIACSSRDAPVHLWDAFTGSIRCSYLSYSQMDELVTPHSLCFSLCGTKLYCGFNKKIRVFHIDNPGRKCEERKTFSKKGQSGIISCMAMSPDQFTYAAGSYSKTIGVYDERSTKLLFLLQGQVGGVTHLLYSSDGMQLYSGGRKDDEILCWDVRNPGKVLYVLERDVQTNQRIYFDISRNGQYIVSGNHNGTVKLWDTRNQPSQTQDDAVLPSIGSFQGHQDAVNGASFHPFFPLMATASGQRRYTTTVDSDESDSEECGIPESSLKLWWCGQQSS